MILNRRSQLGLGHDLIDVIAMDALKRALLESDPRGLDAHQDGPSSALVDLGPSERREGGSRRSTTADHNHLAADVQFCSLPGFN